LPCNNDTKRVSLSLVVYCTGIALLCPWREGRVEDFLSRGYANVSLSGLTAVHFANESLTHTQEKLGEKEENSLTKMQQEGDDAHRVCLTADAREREVQQRLWT
jgi:hypothetical protein